MMRRGFRVGRLFGIDIRIDWSWLIIFLLVTWNLSTTFQQQHPGWSLPGQWGLGLVASLLFFASVLLHELAHSLVARARGTEVSSITLFLFGGVSNIQRHPDSPASEFLITIVGPLTSFVLGIIFLLAAGLQIPSIQNLGQVSQVLQQMGPVATIAMLLGSVNLALGLFNLIPGFPLDGGRVLRSILWGITDDLRRSTRWASWVGQAIAWLMIAAGVAMVFGATIPLFGSGFINGVWLIFIGWFLSSASASSYQQVVIEDVLEDVPVRRMMRENPPTVSPDINLDTLVDQYIMKSDDRTFPVLEDGRLVGMVALDDVREVERANWAITTVRDVMTPTDQLEVVTPDEDGAEALHQLNQSGVRQLPVEEAGHLVGLLRRQDILRWLQLHSELNQQGGLA